MFVDQSTRGLNFNYGMCENLHCDIIVQHYWNIFKYSELYQLKNVPESRILRENFLYSMERILYEELLYSSQHVLRDKLHRHI